MLKIDRLEPEELEKRKERLRRLWDYRPVDHIPIGFWADDFSTYTLWEQCRDSGRQLEQMIANNNRCLRVFSDDYIPMVRIWPGYMTIATMFGMDVFWGDDPNQPPGAAGFIIDSPEKMTALGKPDAKTAGIMPENLKWIAYAASNLPPDIAVTGVDLGGPLNTAKDLFETNFLYTAFIDYPDELCRFLDLITEVQIACYREIVTAAGGLERMVSIDFDPVWAPEGKKGFVSDDVCATISPEAFRQFSIPYNERIFQAFGEGRIHNCGPHPSADLYLEHHPRCLGINCSYRYTRNDFPRIKEAFRGRGILELNFDNGETPEEVLRGFEDAADSLAPDVAAVPVLVFDDSWEDDDLEGTYRELKKTAEIYARSMNWAGE